LLILRLLVSTHALRSNRSFAFFLICLFLKQRVALPYGEKKPLDGFAKRGLCSLLSPVPYAFGFMKGPRRPAPAYEGLERSSPLLSLSERAGSKGLVGVGTKASLREAYEGLVGTKQRGFAGPTPQLLSLRLWFDQRAASPTEEERNGTGSEQQATKGKTGADCLRRNRVSFLFSLFFSKRKNGKAALATKQRPVFKRAKLKNRNILFLAIYI
jgi:hypothetical protein